MKNKKVTLKFMMIAFILIFIVSLSIGRYNIRPDVVVKVMLSKIFPIKSTWESQVETVIFNVRIPRVLLGVLIGGGLSCAGSVFQGVFHNPMVSPDILGASAGAGFGAAIALFFSLGSLLVTVCAFTFGIFAVVLVCIVSKSLKSNQILGLILGGIMVNSVFNGGISYLKLIADPMDSLPSITYWLMGSLASAKMSDVAFVAPCIIVCSTIVYFLRWRLNVLTLGEDEAKSIGVDVKKMRIVMISCATLITASAVSVSGIIGWVGLVIPHFSRMIMKNDYTYSLPASIIIGSGYMLLVDNIARVLTTSEIPIGILTAFVGAPVFLFLIIKQGKEI